MSRLVISTNTGPAQPSRSYVHYPSPSVAMYSAAAPSGSASTPHPSSSSGAASSSTVGAQQPVQPRPPATAPAAAATEFPSYGSWKVIWLVEADRAGQWWQYDVQHATRLEAAWMDSRTIRHAPRGTVQFEYDCVNMTQTNLETNGRRLMRRTLVDPDELAAERQRREAITNFNAQNWTSTAVDARRGNHSRSRGASRSASRSRGPR